MTTNASILHTTTKRIYLRTPPKPQALRVYFHGKTGSLLFQQPQYPRNVYFLCLSGISQIAVPSHNSPDLAPFRPHGYLNINPTSGLVSGGKVSQEPTGQCGECGRTVLFPALTQIG